MRFLWHVLTYRAIRTCIAPSGMSSKNQQDVDHCKKKIHRKFKTTWPPKTEHSQQPQKGGPPIKLKYIQKYKQLGQNIANIHTNHKEVGTCKTKIHTKLKTTSPKHCKHSHQQQRGGPLVKLKYIQNCKQPGQNIANIINIIFVILGDF